VVDLWSKAVDFWNGPICTNVVNFCKYLWNDPVWSKVIAAGILGIFGYLSRKLWLPTIRCCQSKLVDKKQEISASKYLTNQIFIDLFIKNHDRSMYQKLHGHKPEYIRLIEDLKKDGLIVLDKAGIPGLSAKGNKWIARNRKTI